LALPIRYVELPHGKFRSAQPTTCSTSPRGLHAVVHQKVLHADGNHRVSVNRYHGAEQFDVEVIEFPTSVV
jgi:hypothetical protein